MLIPLYCLWRTTPPHSSYTYSMLEFLVIAYIVNEVINIHAQIYFPQLMWDIQHTPHAQRETIYMSQTAHYYIGSTLISYYKIGYWGLLNLYKTSLLGEGYTLTLYTDSNHFPQSMWDIQRGVSVRDRERVKRKLLN